MMGSVERTRRLSPRRAEATIAYPWQELVSDLPQLLNLLFGNISLARGIRLERVDWPDELLSRFPGPRFGVAGLRERLGVPERPLLATSLKPVGLSPRELAHAAAECVLGGIDLLKDDHSLSDQPSAPFRERLFAIAEAVRAANRRSGRRSIYLPNLTGPVDRLFERVDDLREAGVGAAMVAPLLLGFDAVRWLAESSRPPAPRAFGVLGRVHRPQPRPGAVAPLGRPLPSRRLRRRGLPERRRPLSRHRSGLP